MNNFLPFSIILLGNFYFGTGYFNDTDDISCDSDEQTSLSNVSSIELFIKRYPIELWKQHGFFTEKYLELINKHWLQFVPQPKYMHYILAGLYLVIMIIGGGGNLLVIFLFLRCKALRTPANTLVLNLAISDFLMMSKMPVFIYNSFYLGPALGDIACKFYGFIGGLSGTCSICTLTAISVDRFYVIKYPLNRKFTSIRSKIFVFISWIYALAFSCVPLLNLGLGNYVPEGYLTSCSFDYLTDNESAKDFIRAFFIAAWTIPFLIILFAYVSIILAVKLSKKISKDNLTTGESSRHVKVKERRSQEVRLAWVVFFVILLWFIAWTPYAIVALMGIYGCGNLITPLTSMIPALLAKSASCLDPFVYALTHPRFKSELTNLMCNGKLKNDKSVIRMRTTQTHEKRINKKTQTDDEQEDDNLSVIEIKADDCGRIPLRSYDQFPSTLIINDDRVNESPFQGSGKIKKKWWHKPSFSNRTSSIKRLTRSWTSSKDREDNCLDNMSVSEIHITHSI